MREKIFALAVIAALALAIGMCGNAATQNNDAAFVCDFDDLSSDWRVLNEPAPGSIFGINTGSFSPAHAATTGGYLVLKLSQERINNVAVRSAGGGIVSRRLFRYGTFEWRMRAASDSASPCIAGKIYGGSVSAVFIYNRNSETEIEFELEGQNPNTLHMVSWLNPDQSREPHWPDDRTATKAMIADLAFHAYKFVWSPDKIQFYVDDKLVSVHTTHVPKTPAAVMISLWGSNSERWGGTATIGVDRYLLVDWFKYAPL